MNIKKVYNYTNCLQKGLQLAMKPGHSIVCDIYPYHKGYVLNVKAHTGKGCAINMRNKDRLQNIVRKVKIDNVLNVKDYNNVQFNGTTIVGTNNDSITLIKDLNENNWTPIAAGKDIKRLIRRK